MVSLFLSHFKKKLINQVTDLFINKQQVIFLKIISAFYHGFAKESAKRCLLISNVPASNITRKLTFRNIKILCGFLILPFVKLLKRRRLLHVPY